MLLVMVVVVVVVVLVVVAAAAVWTAAVWMFRYCVACQIVLLRTNVAGFRDTLCDTQPVSALSDSDEIFAVELPPVCSDDHVTAVVVNIDTSSSLR